MTTRPHQRRPVALATGVMVGCLLVFGVVARWAWLGSLPGINGDEAWYGTLALRYLAGEAVSWRTPSGNLVSPAHVGMLYLVHWFARPDFFWLRFPTVVASLAQVALAYFLLRRPLGRTAALGAGLLMLALPANFVYARFGWDPSHSGLWILLATACALRARPVLATLLFVFSLWVYPANAFCAPFLVFAYLAGRPTNRSPVAHLAAGGAFTALLAVGLLVLRWTTQGEHLGSALTLAKARLLDGQELAAFLADFGRFASGETSYLYVVGEGFGGPGWLVPSLAWAVMLLAWAGNVAGRASWDARLRALCIPAGFVAALACFYVVAGREALQPHVERFALVLLVPFVLSLVRGEWSPAGAGSPGSPLTQAHFAGTLCLALLLSSTSVTHYFVPLRQHGSLSHPTFWTGEVEPKARALKTILSLREPGKHVFITADSWWTLWPIRYLAYGEDRVTVFDLESAPPPLPGNHQDFMVGLPGEVLDIRYPDESSRLNIDGFGGRTAVLVWPPRR